MADPVVDLGERHRLALRRANRGRDQTRVGALRLVVLRVCGDPSRDFADRVNLADFVGRLLTQLNVGERFAVASFIPKFFDKIRFI